MKNLLLKLVPVVAFVSLAFSASAQNCDPAHHGDNPEACAVYAQSFQRDSAAVQTPVPTATQADTVEYFPRIAAKLNAEVFIGIINPAVEFRIAKHFSCQLEAMAVLWRDGFLGTDVPANIGAGFLEFRYYPKEAMRGFFVGPNFGVGVFRTQKNIFPPYAGAYPPDQYIVGSNVMVGATIGYHFCIGDHWGIEISWGGGWSHAWYEGYRMDENGHGEMTCGWNRSGEWSPAYKTAINVEYRW